MLALLLSNWKPILIGVLIFLVFFAGEHYGANRIQEQWDREKVTEQRAIIDAQAAAETKAAAASKAADEKVQKANDDAETRIRRFANDRIKKHIADCPLPADALELLRAGSGASQEATTH